MTFHCVAGKCTRQAPRGYWLCKQCAERNGENIPYAKGIFPAPHYLLQLKHDA